MTFRWFGLEDSIPLEYIKQIPNMSGVVTAVYDVPAGEVWPMESLFLLKNECDKARLEMEVIESIPVHEDIKLGNDNRDTLINNYSENIRRCAKIGIKCVCYNFMPIFDWLRTNVRHLNSDGSNSLSYSSDDFAKVDPQHLHLPGWDESYSQDELQKLLEQYRHITHEQLFNNLVYFLKKIIPVCEECGVNMAIHPDDPPWDIFGVPRIVSNKNDLDRIFKAVSSTRNGLTLCTGSFGANKNNDLIEIAEIFSKQKRIHFLHARNIKYVEEKDSFVESGHMDVCGSLDLFNIIKVLVINGFDGYVRPDHGRNIWGEDGKPGYGLFDRALGSTYLSGLFEAIEKSK